MAKVWDGGPKCILNRNKAVTDQSLDLKIQLMPRGHEKREKTLEEINLSKMYQAIKQAQENMS